MKGFIIMSLIFINSTIVFGQMSYNTQIAFILRDSTGNKVDLIQFKRDYLLLNAYGDTVSNEDLFHYLQHDEKSGYFFLNIITTGPRFSFALINDNKRMIIYLPFTIKPIHDSYALDFKFNAGKFLFDFKTRSKEILDSKYADLPLYLIEEINWKKQSKKFEKSSYSNDQTYSKIL